MKNRKDWTRRELLAMGTGLTALSAANVFAQELDRTFTPSLILGPFYPQIKPLDQDADLTLIKGRKVKAQGKVIHVAGTLTNIKGEPVRNARIEIWQADTNGRYSHPSDPNPTKLDDNFQGYCVLTTDDRGRYRFKSVMPGAYPGLRPGAPMRTPHIHFEVQAATDRLVTQMFFPGEKLNATDHILRGIRNESARASTIARQMPPTRDIAAGEVLFGWDIVLLSG